MDNGAEKTTANGDWKHQSITDKKHICQEWIWIELGKFDYWCVLRTGRLLVLAGLTASSRYPTVWKVFKIITFGFDWFSTKNIN